MVVDINKIRKSANIIGKSEKMNEMLFMIGQVANTDISVLITGASGTGKEMVAKAIHRNSQGLGFISQVGVNTFAADLSLSRKQAFDRLVWGRWLV